jgi:hypothetical protein
MTITLNRIYKYWLSKTIKCYLFNISYIQINTLYFSALQIKGRCHIPHLTSKRVKKYCINKQKNICNSENQTRKSYK